MSRETGSGSLPVLTALPGAAWEGELVRALDRAGGAVRVVRRCIDISDLLAAVSTGTGRAVLLSAHLRRLDREALATLSAAGVAAVGLVSPGDDAAGQRLRALGLRHVLAADAGPEAIGSAVIEAVRDGARISSSPVVADPAAALAPAQAPGRAGPDVDAARQSAGRGAVVAVWGPTGAPGRTTLAVTLASELALLGEHVLLADADVYGGVVAQVLGLLDEPPGLAAAARLANTGSLDLPALSRLAPSAAPRLRVLAGISRAERWPELRAAALESVWQYARQLCTFTVVDCGFSLERDEEISFDVAAPRRNGATLATLEHADLVLAVGTADPVGLHRLVRGLADLREVVPGADIRVVVNRLRRGPVGDDPERQVRTAVQRHAGIAPAAFVPYDRDGLDRALLLGRALAEVAPRTRARLAVAALAGELVTALTPASPSPEGRWGRRAGRRRRT